MISIVNEDLEKYAQAHSEAENNLLKELARETYAKTKWPQMQVGHLEGAFLRLLVRMVQAKRVLEIGTFTGYSALVMAEGLPKDGELITCDVDPEATQIAQRYWNKSVHGKKIVLKLAPALETIKTLPGSFDLVFIDADKENYVRYWESVMPKIRKGGILAADNVLWGGRVLKPRHATDRAIVQFNKHVQNDPRVETVMLTVRDGMTLAWKK